MEYHLNREVRYSEDSECPNLYKWFLQEYSPDGEKIGQPLIPWEWSFYFEANDLRYRRQISLNTEFDKDNLSDKKEVSEYEDIVADLISGSHLGKSYLSNQTIFSMFGTDREVEKISLSIRSVEEDATEDCTVWGFVSYTAEIDFVDEREDDCVDIQLRLKTSRFQRIVEAISSGAIDSLSLHISGVHGFYSGWSPSIKTDLVKILTDDLEVHKVQTPEGAAFIPPRLGLVNECDIYTYKRAGLDNSQFMQKNDFYDEESEIEPQKSEEDARVVQLRQQYSKMFKPLTDQFLRSQKSILVPLWVIALVLILLLLKK